MFILGCPNDPNTATVDLSKRVKISQPVVHEPSSNTLNIAVASITSPKQSMIYYHELLGYIGAKLGRNISLVQRKTYAEVNTLLGSGDIDLAFICSGPYTLAKQRYQLVPVAMPIILNKETYRSYLIVHRSSSYNNLDDLRGKTFAFSDPESNTGFLVPNYLLNRIGETADHFFSKTFYTYSHDNSIMAVARCLVDGAFVHEQIWEYLNKKHPEFTSHTRVIDQSEPFGNPPIVASPRLPEETIERIKQIFYAFHLDARGKIILDHLMIERFVPVREVLYDPIRQMHQILTEKEVQHAVYQQSKN